MNGAPPQSLSPRGGAAALAWAAVVTLLYLAARDFRIHELISHPFVGRLETAGEAGRSIRQALQLLWAGCVPPLAYLAVGLWAQRVLRIQPRGAEGLAIAYLVGTGLSSLAILALRALDVPVPIEVLALIAASGLALGGRGGERPGAASSVGGSRAADGLALLVGALLFVGALAPETSWDSLEYHLPMLAAWSEGPIRALPAVLDAEFRASADLLFLPAVAAGQPDAAGAVSSCFALALAALIRAEASRWASPAAGSWAALLALLAPLTLENAAITYVDLAAGAYGFLALSAADRWNRTGNTRLLALAALSAGFAANAKLHLFVIAPAAIALACAGGRRPPRAAVAVGGLLLAGVTLPWFIKAGLTTGNPFFPAFGEWFGYGPTTAEHLQRRQLRLRTDFPDAVGLGGFARYVAAITFSDRKFVGGVVGPLPLALAPWALQRVSRATAALLVTLGGLFVLLYAFAPALRFGVALIPFAAVAAARGGVRIARSGRAGSAGMGILLGVVALFHGATLAKAYAPRLAALACPEAYQRAVWPAQDALRRAVARAEPVVAISMGAVAWMPKPVYSLYWERNGEIFFEEDRDPLAVLAVLESRGVRSLVIPTRRAVFERGRFGHALVDAWLASGRARMRRDTEPIPGSRPERVWVIVDLEQPPVLPSTR